MSYPARAEGLVNMVIVGLVFELTYQDVILCINYFAMRSPLVLFLWQFAVFIYSVVESHLSLHRLCSLFCLSRHQSLLVVVSRHHRQFFWSASSRFFVSSSLVISLCWDEEYRVVISRHILFAGMKNIVDTSFDSVHILFLWQHHTVFVPVEEFKDEY